MPQLLTGCHPACVMASAVWPPSWEERAGSGKLMMSLPSAVYTGSLATRALEEEGAANGPARNISPRAAPSARTDVSRAVGLSRPPAARAWSSRSGRAPFPRRPLKPNLGRDGVRADCSGCVALWARDPRAFSARL